MKAKSAAGSSMLVGQEQNVCTSTLSHAWQSEEE